MTLDKIKRLISIKLLRKVPEVTVYFWVIKLLTTAMGESTSDYLVHTINPVIAVVLGGVGLSIALIIQFLSKKYTPWIYWLTVTMVAIFGTMAADVVHIVLGVSYLFSSVFFAILLSVIFISWYKTESTLSIHSILTPRREIFYWLTVMATFALGTSVGDMTAATLGLGYLLSVFLFIFLIAIPALGFWLFGFSEVFSFWSAYIMTRPLGASFADWFGRPPELGGIGVGTGLVSLILEILIILFIIFLTIIQNDRKSEV